NPAQAETCEPSLLKESVAAARDLDVPIHIHAGGNLREFLQIVNTHRKPVVEYLADSGILGPRTILGHMVFMGGHSRVDYPAGEIKLIADSGARPPDVFNAATIGGADALGRNDLGRLAAGAKADVVILNIRTTRYGPARDPINALVEYGSGADVETVIVDGEVVIENGCSTR